MRYMYSEAYSASAIHLKCPVDHSVHALGYHFMLFFSIEQDGFMKITVTDMAKHTSK